jgi:hypothetical protein
MGRQKKLGAKKEFAEPKIIWEQKKTFGRINRQNDA